MKTVTLQEAQQDLAELMVLVGQGEDVLITHDTLPAVKLVASSNISHERQLGQFLGKAQMSEDFDAPLSESFWLGKARIIKAQQLVAQYIPADQDLVAELLDDRQQALLDE